MNQSLENVALRKQLLQARTRLGRLKLSYELHAIKDPQNWMNAGAAALRKIPLRSTLTSMVFYGVGKSRLVSLLTLAKRGLLFAGLTGSIRNLRGKTSVAQKVNKEKSGYVNDDQ
jgi:hypothetical protein